MVGLARERFVVGLSLAGIVALAWLYLWRMPAMGMSSVPVLFAMWVLMMAGMMLPGAAPAVLLYGTLARKHAERGRTLPAVGVFVGGYLLVWAGFSLGAALLQAALQHAALVTPMMTPASKWLSGALLVAAGAYQFTPLKDACLGKCRDPLSFFLTGWRDGAAGALRMGMSHGVYCVGCCWVLMLLLFALGVMNLAFVALIAGFVLLEKLLPAGRLVSRLAGAALIAAGAGYLVTA